MGYKGEDFIRRSDVIRILDLQYQAAKTMLDLDPVHHPHDPHLIRSLEVIFNQVTFLPGYLPDTPGTLHRSEEEDNR